MIKSDRHSMILLRSCKLSFLFWRSFLQFTHCWNLSAHKVDGGKCEGILWFLLFLNFRITNFYSNQNVKADSWRFCVICVKWKYSASATAVLSVRSCLWNTLFQGFLQNCDDIPPKDTAATMLRYNGKLVCKTAHSHRTNILWTPLPVIGRNQTEFTHKEIILQPSSFFSLRKSIDNAHICYFSVNVSLLRASPYVVPLRLVSAITGLFSRLLCHIFIISSIYVAVTERNNCTMFVTSRMLKETWVSKLEMCM